MNHFSTGEIQKIGVSPKDFEAAYDLIKRDEKISTGQCLYELDASYEKRGKLVFSTPLDSFNTNVKGLTTYLKQLAKNQGIAIDYRRQDRNYGKECKRPIFPRQWMIGAIKQWCEECRRSGEIVKHSDII